MEWEGVGQDDVGGIGSPWMKGEPVLAVDKEAL